MVDWLGETSRRGGSSGFQDVVAQVGDLEALEGLRGVVLSVRIESSDVRWRISCPMVGSHSCPPCRGLK